MVRLFLVLILISQTVTGQEVTTLAHVRANGDVTVAANGDVYVADFGNPNRSDGTTVVRITPDGRSSVFASGLPFAPAGVDFDSLGNLIQASFAGDAVNSIAPDGRVTRLGVTDGPVGVVVDANDTIFVAACNQNRILQLQSNGVFKTVASSPLFNCPNGITPGHDGALYVVNHRNTNLLRVDSSGVVTVFATNPGTGNSHIEFANDTYYITGRNAHTVYGVDTGGVVSVVAGTGVDGLTDGPVDQATISRPNGIGVSPDGRFLYLAGTSNFTAPTLAIRRIDLRPNSQTFVINAGLTGSWANHDTLGQGFFIDVVSTSEPPVIAVAWFTYDVSAPAADETDGFGSKQHRWFTALGEIDGATAELTIFLNSGGIFDDPTATTSEVVGTMNIAFSSCTEGLLQYTFDTDERSNQIAISRITPAQMCESLSGL